MGDPRYEDIPYPGKPYACTSPLRLATIAQLVGWDAADVRRAKVLELACGDGLNLIAMAVNLPEAQFVGVDGSPAAIDVGQQCIAELGLTNVSLFVGDIEAIDPESDRFHYIIGHGVYSWVPPSVQDALLRTLQSHLTDDGIGYLSYNTYPRWHLHQLARTLMLSAVRHLDDPQEQLVRAREVLKRVAEADSPATFHGRTLKTMAGRLLDASDASLYHDYLAPFNAPCTVSEFIGRAAGHGLVFLGEAEPWDMLEGLVPENLRDLLGDVPEGAANAQLTDALVGRGFRRSLLVRGSEQKPFRVDQDNVLNLFAYIRGEPEKRFNVVQPEPAHLRSMTGARVTVGDPTLRAFLLSLLDCAPSGRRIGDLIDEAIAASELAGVPPTSKERMASRMLDLFAAMLLELRVEPPYAYGTVEPTDMESRPTGNPVARWQLRRGSEWVVNADHYSVSPPPVAVLALNAADGETSLADMLEIAVQAALDGTIDVSDRNGPITDPDALREELQPELEGAVQFLEEAMLLATVPHP
jgi:2-polyprenyl-3-methyl-5-hydroxy-6-metoxy-1,4-benzoquinol methylase